MLADTNPENGKDRGNSADVCPHCKAKVEHKDVARSHPNRVMVVLFVCSLAVFLIFWFLLNYLRAQADRCHCGCQTNMHNIGTAMEMYITDNNTYPAKMQDLVPDYITSIPACPAVHKDTYSSSYVRSKTMKAYTFICAGGNHPVESGYPQYNYRLGVINGK